MVTIMKALNYLNLLFRKLIFKHLQALTHLFHNIIVCFHLQVRLEKRFYMGHLMAK